ncbi:hypothetical protein HII31_06045 [Pseudocercospora fuligena]|uniref:Uncharacterized protein n=1 Tax=Pseudocercospora fuligena TaxID=685502 RepID=A0A8H6RJG8_9PEZI|nr:hypothetical protein HII31_06045 [Pseudocercospora fuligena]
MTAVFDSCPSADGDKMRIRMLSDPAAEYSTNPELYLASPTGLHSRTGGVVTNSCSCRTRLDLDRKHTVQELAIMPMFPDTYQCAKSTILHGGMTKAVPTKSMVFLAHVVATQLNLAAGSPSAFPGFCFRVPTVVPVRPESKRLRQ